MQTKRFQSRFGFLLLGAGCSIGIGNLWGFPYQVSHYGGSIYILVYILFLVLIGIPLMTIELAVGRGSGKSIICAFSALEKEDQRWHLGRRITVAGNLLMLGVYILAGAWTLYYFFQAVLGRFDFAGAAGSKQIFDSLVQTPWKVILSAAAILLIAFICSRAKGIQQMERICRGMVLLLFGFLAALLCLSLESEMVVEGLAEYFGFNWKRAFESGLLSMLESAMNQAILSLGVGIGIMTLLGGYLDNSHSLPGDALWITGLDTIAALGAGLCINLICHACGAEVTSGPMLLFVTLPGILYRLPFGRIWGTLFFLITLLSVCTTTMILFKNLAVMAEDNKKWSEKQASCKLVITFALGITAIALLLASISFKWQENYAVTLISIVNFVLGSLVLPLGALCYIYECTAKMGWGFAKLKKEADKGQGPKFPGRMQKYLNYVLPAIIIVLMVVGWLK